MLFRIAGVLAVSGFLPLILHAQSPPDSADGGKADDLYWIVDSKDAISYRSPIGGEHVFKGHFNPLRPPKRAGSATTRAKAPAPPELPMCTLSYVTAESIGTLTDQIPPNRWVLMSSIKGIPKPTRVVRPQRQLLEEMGRKTQRSGLSKGTGCAGTLPVVAPVCQEKIDINDFIVEWNDPPGGGEYATLIVETIDELHSESIRLDRVPLSAHHYENPRLKKFLETVQKDSAPTNLVLRFSHSPDVEATRIVIIPSRVDQKALHQELDMVQEQLPLVRAISLVSTYVDFGLWSKAGRQARELLALAPDEEMAMTYALIGFCHSGYARETAELRTSLNRIGITDICPEGQK